MIKTRTISSIARRLLPWFARHARDLPWRRLRDPYGIWVSEVMLQQTQVKTVVPYWTRWMKALPTVQALARARPQRIHKLWEGLGYYTRVRNLQKAAWAIMEQHGGEFPQSYEQVLALPGIGRYTAGAICSIAFDQPTPILDGNVIRVLTRLFGVTGDPREKRTNALLWELAERLVAEGARGRGVRAPGDCSQLNQALMELGALVCVPRIPRCEACPVRQHCVARRLGCVEELPARARRARSTQRRFHAFILRHGAKYLVRQRPAGVVNAHLWEFPNREASGDEDERRTFQSLFGAKPIALKKLCTIKHTITRYRITLEVFTSEGRTMLPNGDSQWLSVEGMRRMAFASAHRKLVEKLAGDGYKIPE